MGWYFGLLSETVVVTEGCFSFLHKPCASRAYIPSIFFGFSHHLCIWFCVAGTARRSSLYVWLNQEQVNPHARESSLHTSGRYLYPAMPLTCGKALHNVLTQHVPLQRQVPSPSPWRIGRKSQKASTGYCPSRGKL